MTLAIGPVTDYLVTQARQAVTGLPDTWQVSDSLPDELTNFMFVVGVTEPPPNDSAETLEQRAWNGLGAGKLEEDFTVDCYIDVRVAGTTQKTARDKAEAAFNAFWPLLKADLTLGGLLGGGRYVEIPNLAEVPSHVGTVAEPGRRQLIRFGVHCRNLTS